MKEDLLNRYIQYPPEHCNYAQIHGLAHGGEMNKLLGIYILKKYKNLKS